MPAGWALTLNPEKPGTTTRQADSFVVVILDYAGRWPENRDKACVGTRGWRSGGGRAVVRNRRRQDHD
jgi:hypothetical protein